MSAPTVQGPITSIRLQGSRIADGMRSGTIAFKFTCGKQRHYRIDDVEHVSHESYIARAKAYGKDMFDKCVAEGLHDVAIGGDFDSLWSVEEAR